MLKGRFILLDPMRHVARPYRACICINSYFSRDGELPIDTFGGLLGRGHPVGASGVYQVRVTLSQLLRFALVVNEVSPCVV